MSASRTPKSAAGSRARDGWTTEHSAHDGDTPLQRVRPGRVLAPPPQLPEDAVMAYVLGLGPTVLCVLLYATAYYWAHR